MIVEKIKRALVGDGQDQLQWRLVITVQACHAVFTRSCWTSCWQGKSP